jgi:FAD/FMN-containing dehydrogenase
LGVLVSSNTTFAIRGGGHSPLPAWANIDNGVLIAMSKINDCSYNKESETIRVGFGNSWGDVYSYLEPFDRIVVGGRAPSVGLATLLGGKSKPDIMSSMAYLTL